jgi:hypothetical protein
VDITKIDHPHRSLKPWKMDQMNHIEIKKKLAVSRKKLPEIGLRDGWLLG